MSLWFKADSLSGSPVVLGYGGNSCGQSWFMAINHGDPTANTLHLEGHCNVNQLDYAYESPPVADWYHWVIVTSTNGTKMYVNGVERKSSTLYVTNTYVTGKDLAIGVNVGPGGRAPYTDRHSGYFRGDIDEIRIYDRALSESEIKYLYGMSAAAAR